MTEALSIADSINHVYQPTLTDQSPEQLSSGKYFFAINIVIVTRDVLAQINIELNTSYFIVLLLLDIICLMFILCHVGDHRVQKIFVISGDLIYLYMNKQIVKQKEPGLCASEGQNN